jgi:hypothetical protein
MLKNRVLATLQFFALQDIPLTLFEVHKYLLNDVETIKKFLDDKWEVQELAESKAIQAVSLTEVLHCLEQECADAVKQFRGHYYLVQNDEQFVAKRLHNYLYAVKRERRIRWASKFLCHVPFLRGIGLVGSQALGQYQPHSDIDVLVIVHRHFMWLARLLVTFYFQVLGLRRHGKKIANRFCLNHYLSHPKTLQQDRNIYTATEYLKLRPLYDSNELIQFRNNNLGWMRLFFPHAEPEEEIATVQSDLQWLLEKLLTNRFGRWLEQQARKLQLRRINQDEFITVEEDELSFHPDNRKVQLFSAFFEDHQ